MIDKTNLYTDFVVTPNKQSFLNIERGATNELTNRNSNKSPKTKTIESSISGVYLT